MSLRTILNVALASAGTGALSSSIACGRTCDLGRTHEVAGIEFRPALENARVTVVTGERFAIRGLAFASGLSNEVVIEEEIADAERYTFECVDGVFLNESGYEETCDFFAFYRDNTPLEVAVTIVADSGESLRLPKEEGALTNVAFVRLALPPDNSNCQESILRARVYVDTSALAP